MCIPLITSVFLMLTTFPMCSAQENLALGKPAWQSSVYSKYSADGAVDGVRTHKLDTSDGLCAHTSHEENPWWSVDLGDTYRVHTVIIYNRDNEPPCSTCRQRLREFEIFVHDCPTCDKHLCFQGPSDNLTLVINVTCDSPVTGRYLNISLPRRGILTLCEVEVYGDALLQTSASSMGVPTTDIMFTEALPSHISDKVTVNTAGYLTETPCVDGCFDSRVPGSSYQVEPTSVTELLEASHPLVTLMSDVLLPSSATVLPFPSSIHLDSSITLGSTWNNKDGCYCPCFSGPKSNDSKEDFMSSIIENLEIDTKNVSKRRRRYISAPDDRVSSQTMGYLGIAMMALVFGPFVLMDAVSLVYFLRKKCSNRVKPE